ncbi:MAG TPA: hypothetical protein VL131_05925 [Gammaproteobacteria bacterium]|nr:hypothetical protein [Gammaproteobacteria bacterium]
MSEQRQTNPLPIGRYWVDVSDTPKAPTLVDDFGAWADSNTSKVHVETTEETPAEHGNPRRLFAIFSVSAPVFFPAANFGFPNDAPPNVHSEQDVFGAPPPDPPGLQLPSFGDLAGVLPLLLILAVVLAAGNSRRRSEAWG